MEENLIEYYNRIISVGDNILDNLVYIESHVGTDFAGNMYYMAKTFLEENGDSIVSVVVNDANNLPVNLKLLINEYGADRIRIIKKDTESQIECLATAKYLMTDVQFASFFKKRAGQVCVQTWHGTPLKKLGFDYYNDVAWTGGQKKSFIISDIVLYPNEYTQKCMNDSYRLTDYTFNNLISGYPRNSVFFDENKRLIVRENERIQNKTVYAYMPTWRGGLNSLVDSRAEIVGLLDRMESSLKDDEVFYVKLHRLMKEHIDFAKYDRIREFPDEFETYEFLCAIDCLITDYSSVMFDYLCTRKKTILYLYDKKEYLKHQGLYFDIEDLPFPETYSLDELFDEMHKPKEYDDQQAFEKFCRYDGPDASKKLYDLMINKSTSAVDNNSDNRGVFMLYGGKLTPGSHTMEFVDYIDSLISDTKNHIIVTYKNIEYINNPLRLQVFPKPIDLLSVDYYKNDVLYNSANCKNEKLWTTAFNTQFQNVNIKKVICFPDEYDEMLKLFASADCDVTFVLDKSLKQGDADKIRKLAKEKNISLVDRLEAVTV